MIDRWEAEALKFDLRSLCTKSQNLKGLEDATMIFDAPVQKLKMHTYLVILQM